MATSCTSFQSCAVLRTAIVGFNTRGHVIWLKMFIHYVSPERVLGPFKSFLQLVKSR